MQKGTTLLSLLTFSALLIGCAEKSGSALTGLPDDVFVTEAEHEGPLETVGELAEAYVENTSALRRANNKLSTICVAAARCKEE